MAQRAPGALINAIGTYLRHYHRHQIQIVLPSGMANDLTRTNPRERAAASAFHRVIVDPLGGGSPVISAFSRCGEISWRRYDATVSPSVKARR